MKMTESRLCW